MTKKDTRRTKEDEGGYKEDEERYKEDEGGYKEDEGGRRRIQGGRRRRTKKDTRGRNSTWPSQRLTEVVAGCRHTTHICQQSTA